MAGNLIVDMRSGAYAAAWKPRAAELLAVRAFSEAGGERKPVSHMAKAVRGEVARALLEAKAAPADAEAAAAIAEAAGFEVELSPGHLDVIVRRLTPPPGRPMADPPYSADRPSRPAGAARSRGG